MTSSRIVVIDDLRRFNKTAEDQLNDETDLYYARTSEEGIKILTMLHEQGLYIHQLWLDHDLGGMDTIMPVVDLLCEDAAHDRFHQIQTIIVHTSNPGAGDSMMRSLRAYGYRATRVLAEKYFTI